MLRKLAIIPVLFAAAAMAANAPADPYDDLPSIDFGRKNSAAEIIDQVHNAPVSAHAAIEAKLLAAVSKPNASFACKQFVADMLRIVGSKASIPVVMKWLDDPKTADLPAFALQGMSGAEVDDALLKAMRATHGSVQLGLGNALAARHNNAVLPDLAALVGGGDAPIAKAAVAAMGNVGTVEAVAALKALNVSETLAGERELAMLVAADRLVAAGNKPAAVSVWQDLFKGSQRVNVISASLDGLVQIDPAAAAPAVFQALKDSRWQIALRAAGILRTLPGNSITADLCAAFPSLKPNVQVAVLYTLSARGDRAAFPTVKAAMQSKDPAVQCQAIRACLALGDASIVQPLVDLAVKDGPAADTAQEVLGRLNQPGVEPMLLPQLKQPKADAVRIAVNILVARGYRAALPQMLELIGNKDGGIRDSGIHGAEAFAGVGDVPSLMALVASAAHDREKIARVMWAACRGINPKEQRFVYIWKAVPANADIAVRGAVLQIAAAAGGAEPLKIVREQCNSADAKFKDIAIRAMLSWPDEEAAEATLDLLKTTDSLTYRVLAARSLASRLTDHHARLPVAKRQTMLREALQKLDRPEDKKLIESALEKLSGKK